MTSSVTDAVGDTVAEALALGDEALDLLANPGNLSFRCQHLLELPGAPLQQIGQTPFGIASVRQSSVDVDDLIYQRPRRFAILRSLFQAP